LERGVVLREKLPVSEVSAMSKVELIEKQIKTLSAKEVAKLREWFLEFDWMLWDQQIERDVAAGKLNGLADKALRDHAAGKTTPL
jgi:hypothetical protein